MFEKTIWGELKRFVLVCFVGGAALVMAANDYMNADFDRAKAFISGFVKDAMMTISSKEMPRPERLKQFESMVTWYFSVDRMGRFAAGRYWKAGSEDDQKAYIAAFRDFSVMTWENRLSGYDGETVEVGAARAHDDGTILVEMFVAMKDGRKIPVMWRLQQDKRRFSVVDVMIESVSLATTMRSDFSSITRQSGGALSGLTKALIAKASSLRDQSPG